MANLSLPARDSVDAQRELFRIAARDYGLTISVIAARSPLCESTMKGWRDGAAMPAWAVGALGEAGIPDHLLSLVLEPFGRFVVTDDDGEGDLDTAGLDAGDVAHAVQRARHPNSPGGIAIVPQERAEIIPIIRAIRDSGITILLIEHVMRAVMHLSQRAWVLNDGALIASGPPAAIAADSKVVEAYLGRGARRVAEPGVAAHA